VHNTQPWRFDLHDEWMGLRADRSRQLRATDPLARELVISAGAALMNARIGVAVAGWSARCDRFPRADDPDLLARLAPVTGRPDGALAQLAPQIARRHTNRRAYLGDPLPDEVLRQLTDLARQEESLLVPIVDDRNRRLLGRLARQADREQNADPDYRAELRQWTTRPRESRDGVPPGAVPRVDGEQQDEVPIRDFDTEGRGQLPPAAHSDPDQTLLLLATRTDEPVAWLRAGEALERMLLELTALGWVTEPMTQALEVPATRTQVRAALTGGAHPQMLLRVGRAAQTPRTPRRPSGEVVSGARPPAPPLQATPPPLQQPAHRAQPVSDGRGGTTWR
jgi:hypothetical protein